MSLVVIKPFISPKTNAASAKIGIKYATPACGISQSLTTINCPAMCAKAEKMLRVMALKCFFGRCCAKNKALKLKAAPLRLNTKVGDKN